MFLKTYSKGNILAKVETFSSLSEQKFWQKFCKNGVIKTNFCRLIVARAFHRSNVLCRQEIQNRAMIIKSSLLRIGTSRHFDFKGRVHPPYPYLLRIKRSASDSASDLEQVYKLPQTWISANSFAFCRSNSLSCFWCSSSPFLS